MASLVRTVSSTNAEEMGIEAQRPLFRVWVRSKTWDQESGKLRLEIVYYSGSAGIRSVFPSGKAPWRSVFLGTVLDMLLDL